MCSSWFYQNADKDKLERFIEELDLSKENGQTEKSKGSELGTGIRSRTWTHSTKSAPWLSKTNGIKWDVSEVKHELGLCGMDKVENMETWQKMRT